MDYSSLHMKTVVELRRLAKEMHVSLPAGMSKADIVQTLLDAEKNVFQPEASEPRRRGRPRKNPIPELNGTPETAPAAVSAVPNVSLSSEPVCGRISPMPRIQARQPAAQADAPAPLRNSAIRSDMLKSTYPAYSQSAPQGEYNTMNPAVLEMLNTGPCH